jgi:hypothetical protein
MPIILREVAEHSLDIRASSKPVRQRLRRFDEKKRRAIREKIHKLLAAGFIKEVFHPEWLADSTSGCEECVLITLVSTRLVRNICSLYHELIK